MITLGICVIGLLFGFSCARESHTQLLRKDLTRFLDTYNQLWRDLYRIAAEAAWKASTDVTEQHVGERIGAEKALASFQGNPLIISETKKFLEERDLLEPIEHKQLEKILLNAAEAPGTIPEVVSARVEEEARASAVLDSFVYCLEKRGGRCIKEVTPNQIDDVLLKSTDLSERLRYWEVSKQVGVPLKEHLVHLRDLRNRVAQELGYSSYFHLQVADYGMGVDEMLQLMDETLRAIRPLYQQLHLYVRNVLAKRYGQQAPKAIPAHWLPNRWGQEWPGIVEAANLDPYFRKQKPEWIVKQAEAFYTSLGLPALPQSFWEKSDLYQLPPGSKRRKNTHASAWHIDLDQDVRSLMSVIPNFRWFETAHHELGHVYYFLAYSNPRVPYVLRDGANRAFHEALGDLIGMAARQPQYLKQIGILPKDYKVDRIQWLLAEALDSAVVFLPWSAGVMTHFEYELYERNLPPERFNQRWWELKLQYQGIMPPAPRGEEYCDPCTKTHIIDDPAQYYDYAIAYLLKYQLHDYIARNILKQDPHDCNYYGNKEVGKWLWSLMEVGATQDWRRLIREKTGEEISPRAMVEYFSPLLDYLKKVNAGIDPSWE